MHPRFPWHSRPPIPDYPPKEAFLSGRRSFAGRTNPEVVDEPYWTWAVRTGAGPFGAREHYRVDLLKRPAIWTFARTGMASVMLDEHVVVSIGGEHEYSCDPDFQIYNDVVVRDFNGGVWIYAYPYADFPPTDFHTATLIEDGRAILIVGGLGYQKDREPWRTPVYRLDIEDMTVRPLHTAGDEPGWIFKHDAHLARPNRITVRGGERWTLEKTTVPNTSVHEFNLLALRWTRLA